MFYFSSASCADFGSSGSGVVREWKEYDSVDSVDYPFPCNKKSKHYQHSFVGPLSMSKGCDLAIPNLLNEDFDQDKYNPEFIYRGSSKFLDRRQLIYSIILCIRIQSSRCY